MRPAGKRLCSPGAFLEPQATMKLTATLLVFAATLLGHSGEWPWPWLWPFAMGPPQPLQLVLTLLPSHCGYQAPPLTTTSQGSPTLCAGSSAPSWGLQGPLGSAWSEPSGLLSCPELPGSLLLPPPPGSHCLRLVQVLALVWRHLSSLSHPLRHLQVPPPPESLPGHTELTSPPTSAPSGRLLCPCPASSWLGPGTVSWPPVQLARHRGWASLRTCWRRRALSRWVLLVCLCSQLLLSFLT